MPVFSLNRRLVFPPPELAEPDGLLAVGGDLRPERILLAYSMGIFPWYSDDSPILWWSPDPRLVLFPDELKVSRSLRQVSKRGDFRITYDQAFEAVIRNCATVKRPGGDGTWLTDDMIEAYCRLHEMGHAHSVESWQNGELVGGLYGLSMGRIFFGESMFANRSNASKVAFAELVENLRDSAYELIDCQVSTEHLLNFGAREISGDEFRRILKGAGGQAPVSVPWLLP